jgi:bifunctional dihydroflavonol 4-reductase/flavanone 4-reductase
LQNEVIKPTVEGMISILRACKEAGTVRRIVFTSSAGTVNVEELRKPVYDEDSWTDVDFCRRVKMTGWVRNVATYLPCGRPIQLRTSSLVGHACMAHIWRPR